MNENHAVDPSSQDPSNGVAPPAQYPSYAPGAAGKQLFTDTEVAEYLSVSVSTVRRWRLKGGGPRWIRIGSSIRYHSADLHAYVANVPSGGGTGATRVN